MTENQILEEIKKAKGNYPKIYKILTQNKQTDKICLLAVKKNGMVIEYVKNKTKDICLAAVKESGMSLQYISNRNEDLCLKAISQCGYALQFVKDQTEEMCLYAVIQDGRCLQYVKKQTIDICINAMDHREQIEYVYRFVKIVKNPDYETTMSNLLNLKKKEDKKELKKKVSRL